MLYRYEDLGDHQFETLIVLLCRRLLGAGVRGFARGPDGGRDAKFMGVAELIPSKCAPWSGTVIVQAKHTNAYNKAFSETDFFNVGSDRNVIAEEISRLRKLRAAKQLDHYMLFSNRKLGANIDQTITDHISTETGLPPSSILLYGIEEIEPWLKQFNDVPKLANLDPIESPLIVSPDELAMVVEAFRNHDGALKEAIEMHPVERMPYERKNEINNMSADYARTQRKYFLKDTVQIQNFLAAPENKEVLESYETAVTEFQLKIIANRHAFQSFDKVMEYLTDLLFGRDHVLRANKRLTRALIFYMYWNCDIGLEEKNAATV
ncbi:ABC-three component system protein [Ochrobactrum sp. EDr1-4]|uniref:ABC-three component system protein n=1 Tax=Ochrobactrum sp. EDr1-4 TaxID=3368622 RepID=UPI003B9ECBA2